ncbi:hypothetical protein INT45_009412, partial [Circinella minor]
MGKKSSLTNRQKLAICLKKQREKITQSELARWAKDEFKLDKLPGQQTISDILKKEEEYMAMTEHRLNAKKIREPALPELELLLAQYITDMANASQPISMASIIHQAKIQCRRRQLEVPEDFQFSIGWLTKFMRRYGFKSRRIHGESGEVEVNADNIQDEFNAVKAKISEFPPERIYNIDETGLFYKQVPRRTISKQSIGGLKVDKNRITVVCVCNADGSHRISPYFIGRYETGQGFNGKISNAYKYYNNTKAWMTKEIFRKILRKIDSAVYAAHKGKRVLLLMDNAPSHKNLDIKLENIEICMLPPNTTSHYQPLDAGIIAAFKKKYRAMLFHQATIRYNEGKLEKLYDIKLKQALDWSKMAWERVTPETIRNCFLHTGLMSNEVSEEEVAAQEAAVLKDDLDLNEQINNHLVTVGTGEDSLDTVNLSSNDENDDIHEILTMDQRFNQLMNSQQ